MMRQAPLDMTCSKKPWSYNFLELAMVVSCDRPGYLQY